MKRYYALCVDDERAVLDELAHHLEHYFENFCQFEYAESGEEAFELYEHLTDRGDAVWLVMSDQVMPGMSGDELLARIHERSRHVMKVLITGRVELGSTIRAINHAGLNYYIEKPWTREELLFILDKLKFQYEMSTVLNELNLHFASSINLNDTLHTVFHNIIKIIQAEAGAIFLLDPYSRTLACKISQGPKDITGVRVPLGKGIVGYVAETRQVDVTTDVKHDKRHYSAIDEQSGFETKSMVSVPLLTKGEVLGVIQVVNKIGGKTFSQDDITLLQALSNGGAVAIQNAQYALRLLQEERIRSELLIAHQIQQGILPGPFTGHPELEIEATNEPAKDVGGDFYDYFQINDDEFAFVIGDVCGKGVPAAIFMASSRSIIKSQALSNPQPLKVMSLANKLITEDAQPGMFVTVFYGLYNVRTRLLRFVNAGHSAVLLYRVSTNSCSSLLNTNLPVGLMSPVEFQETDILLEKDDRLVLYTDGVNEAMNQNLEQFGMNRLIETVFEYGNRLPKELQDAIIEKVQIFAENQEQHDDITVMIVKV